MAISLVGANVEVAGYKTNGTATSGTATTLVNSAAPFTSNALNKVTGSAYTVWIISGTGAGASGSIISNTTTTLTVEDGFYRFNYTTKAFEAITPDNTSVYAVAYNCADAIAALPANCSWENATTKRTMICNKQMLVKAAGAFADSGRNLEFTTTDTFLSSEQTSFFQWGRMNGSFAGVDGGVMKVERTSNAAWVFHNARGIYNLYGTKMVADRVIDTNTGEVGLNGGAGHLVTDGVKVVDSSVENFDLCTFENDVYINVENFNAQIAMEYSPALMENMTANEAVYAVDILSPGWAGGDIFNGKVRGSAASAGWNWQRPLAMYDSQLPQCVLYYWNLHLGIYSTLTDVVDWYTTANKAGINYLGTTLALSTKNSAGANLGTVAVGVIKTSDGVGQIITAKQASGANYAPTKARFITTDANGAYAGPFGSGKGIFVASYKLVYGGSRYVSTVTDYTGYSLILTKYGYVQQILSRSWAYNMANAETAYCAADAYVSAAYATAISYTGIAMTPAAKTLVLSGARALQEFYDFIKARVEYEAKTNDVHVADPLTTTDGTTYTLASDWTLTPESYLTWSKRIAGGTIKFTAPGTYTPKLGTCTVTFTTAGTYTLNGADMIGTATLVNTSGGAVTVYAPVGVTIVNTGPNITVIAGTVPITAPNLVAGTRVRLYNVTDGVEIDNSVVSGAGGYTYNYTFTANFTARLDATYQSGVTAKVPIVGVVAGVTSAGASFVNAQVDDAAYIAWGLDGSVITEFAADTTGHIYIELNDPDGATTKVRLGAWYAYYITTANGIRYYAGAMDFISAAEIRINQSVVNLLLENVNATQTVRFTDTTVRMYRADGSTIIAPTSYSLHSDYSGVPDVVNLPTLEASLGNIESRLPAALVGGKMAIDAAAVWADAQALKLIKTGSNKHVLNPADGTIKIYDDDNTTLIYSGLAYSDAAGTVLYDGTAPVHHTTRLA